MMQLPSIVLIIGLTVGSTIAAQVSPRMASLVEALRPVLPFPSSTASGDLPADNSAALKWFVIWPTGPEDMRIIVRANPLHPDVQEASADAMEKINIAVAAAERRARESYERALDSLRRTGKSGELEVISLEDEGIAGERIDAELEVTIELATVDSFEISSGEEPVVQPGTNGAAWIVTIPPNAYRTTTGDDRREHFRAAESRVYLGVTARPQVAKHEGPVYRVTLGESAPKTAAAVIIRGNASLVSALTTATDWSRLVSP
jgi:hypothetical protein